MDNLIRILVDKSGGEGIVHSDSPGRVALRAALADMSCTDLRSVIGQGRQGMPKSGPKWRLISIAEGEVLWAFRQGRKAVSR